MVRVIILVVVCLTCAGLSRRVKLARSNVESRSWKDCQTAQNYDDMSTSSLGNNELPPLPSNRQHVQQNTSSLGSPSYLSATSKAGSSSVLEMLALLSLAVSTGAFQLSWTNARAAGPARLSDGLVANSPEGNWAGKGPEDEPVGSRSFAPKMQPFKVPLKGPESFQQQAEVAGSGAQDIITTPEDIMDMLDAKPSHFHPEGWQVSRSTAEGLLKLLDELQAGEKTQREELLKFDTVLHALKKDLPTILLNEPDWDNFANNFRAMHGKHPLLEGLAPNKLLWNMLHHACKKLVLQDDVQVDNEHHMIFVPGALYPFCPLLVVAGAEVGVRWKVVLRSRENPVLSMFSSSVNIEAHTIFHLNDAQKVDSVMIDKILVNGQQVQSLPKIQLFDDPHHNLKNIKEWARTTSNLKLRPVNPELERFRHIKASSYSKPPAMASTLIGQYAPDFKMELIGGEKRNLYDILAEGKPIVIDFYMNF